MPNIRDGAGGRMAQTDAIRRAFPPLPREAIAARCLARARNPALRPVAALPVLWTTGRGFVGGAPSPLRRFLRSARLATIVPAPWRAETPPFPPTPELARVEIVHAGHGIGTLAASSKRVGSQDRASRGGFSATSGRPVGMDRRANGSRAASRDARPAAGRRTVVPHSGARRLPLRDRRRRAHRPVAEAAGGAAGAWRRGGRRVAALVWKSGDSFSASPARSPRPHGIARRDSANAATPEIQSFLRGS